MVHPLSFRDLVVVISFVLKGGVVQLLLRSLGGHSHNFSLVLPLDILKFDFGAIEPHHAADLIPFKGIPTIFLCTNEICGGSGIEN